MKRTIFILIAFIVSSISAYAEPISYQATTANIAAWNLSGFYAIPTTKSETFANAIAYIDPEVLALVEVNPDSILDKIITELKKIGICYKKVILDQTASQNIAVLYKCDVQVTNPRLIEDSDNNNSSLRKAFVADVKIGDFDFIIISLHLKAGRGNTERSVRDNQAVAIANFIQNAVAGDEKDILVVGDYNMIPVDDASNFSNMNPNNYLSFISDSVASQFTHISSSGPGNLLDGFAISKDHTDEYIAESIRIIQLHSILGLQLMEYRNTVSDHLPMEASFRITEDDD
jgi:endonuclease/exonuclease/phosphatase family metal-dependent hydrolase